jgi:hypothetical protein
MISICHRVDLASDRQSIPIGRPLPGYRCLVVDEFQQPVVIGQAGELIVGGVGVFTGYLGRDDLTSMVLLHHSDGYTYYRTGDLVRINPQSEFEYVGRKDFQIKLRGQRIELGEIEKCVLDGSPLASSCVVAACDDEHIVAYVQTSESKSNELSTVLLKHCQAHLPDHMVPSAFILLEQFPLNVNGKINRKALPKVDFTKNEACDKVYIGPSNDLERQIVQLWHEILKIEPSSISVTANFFRLGGVSLSLMKLYHRYQSYLGMDVQMVPLTLLFTKSTIQEHAMLIANAQYQTTTTELHHIEQPLSIIEGGY